MAGDIIWNNHELDVMLLGPQGAVARDTIQRGIRVHWYAVGHCPVDTGNLRSALTWEYELTADGPSVKVGSNVEYHPYVELGTYRMRARPHLVPGLKMAA